MTNEQIKAKVIDALGELTRNEGKVIKFKTHEQCISHKLAEYLQIRCPEYNVDCEYDRNNCDGETHTKYLQEYKEKIQREDPDVTGNVRPDIIIHKRFANDNNLLIIEVKKDKNPDANLDTRKSKEKITAFTSQEHGNKFHFRLGLYLKINTKDVSFDLYWAEDESIACISQHIKFEF